MPGGSNALRGARVQPRLAESIAADLREQILGGAYAGGMLPKQETLIDLFGVSAPPMREALRILEGEGLITVRRGKVGGAIVHRPNGTSMAHAVGMALQGEQVSLADLAESILWLEPSCTAACATREDRLSVLKPLVEVNLEHTKDAIGDGPAFTHRSREFHDLLVAHTPQVTTGLVVRSLVAVWSAQEETWAHTVSEVGNYPSRSQQETALRAHRRIAERIFNGDQDGTEHAACAHLSASQKHVLAEFGDRVVDAASPRAVRGLRDISAQQSINRSRLYDEAVATNGSG
jgi:DNA-binding FadR family transcriptional regulator